MWPYNLAQSFCSSCRGKMGMLGREKVHGADLWPDTLRLHDLLPPPSFPITSREAPGSVELPDVMTQSVHVQYMFVPAVSFAWDPSLHSALKDLVQAPPLGRLPDLSPFPFPRPCCPPGCLSFWHPLDFPVWERLPHSCFDSFSVGFTR